MSWNYAGDSRYGIHSIDHFALEVPSLAQASAFFSSFGLEVRRVADHLELRAAGQQHAWARIHEGPYRRLAYLSLSCYAEEFAGLSAQLDAEGARAATALPYTDGRGRWFLDPDGNLVQLKVGPKTTPSGISTREDAARRGGQRAAQPRSQAHRVQPRRLSHVVLFTSNVDRSLRFYQAALGLRLSDRSGNAVAFTHARHGSDHHLIAFVSGGSKGWHHSAWDVASVNEVGAGAEQMRKAGYAEGWGTGRHVLGSNYFHYVRDPWGSFAEYSAEMDFVPTGTQWSAADHPPEDSLYLWGPDLPADFVRNTEFVPSDEDTDSTTPMEKDAR
ncbi:VOC family protein [Variovorax humicola]|uniref:VOC family protein n=1 Tax=Variovorax humicola TaxID=1769758 RepID=A0ABU8VTQ6_9BURK